MGLMRIVSADPFGRRGFLSLAGIALSGLFPGVEPLRALARRLRTGHPTPRPGITAEKIRAKDQLGGSKNLIELFDQVREIPEVIDGIRCNCGCADIPDFYSLLTCYEGDAMARSCPICQGEGRLAARLHKEGKTLDEIRAAIDARFG
ncbi:MAG: hypothetical protein HOP28_06570 [Gemmatimonadales bacterium]|nr:hypothetical protein [Gemmatimonadales bacterium]